MSKKCPMCGKAVYFAERQSAGGYDYHKLCFKCRLCGKPLQPGSSSENKGIAYCKPCYGSGYKFASTEGMTGGIRIESSPPSSVSPQQVTTTVSYVSKSTPAPQVQFCSQCGTRSGGGNFCTSCGARF